MDDELEKIFERNFIYNTSQNCPFCEGLMLPLKIETVWLYDHIPGSLKACNQCGIVKFYPDKSEEVKISEQGCRIRGMGR